MYGQLIVDGNDKFTLGSADYRKNSRQLVLCTNSLKILKDEDYMNRLSDIQRSKLMVQVYDEIIKIMKNKYSLFISNTEKLLEKRDIFCGLSFDEQKIVIWKIIIDLHNGPFTKIQELGINNKMGTFQTKHGIILTENAIVIYQSPSGLFERKVRLKDL